MSALSRLPQSAVHAYQHYVSKDYNAMRGSQCAFGPSCSEFAKEKIADEGLSGVMDAIYRLRRCTKETSGARFTSLLRYTLHCPEDKVESFFTFTSPEMRAKWDAFRAELTQSQAALDSGDTQTGAARVEDPLRRFSKSVHVEQHGELRADQTPHFTLVPRREASEPQRADRGRLANTVRRAAAATIGTLSATAGALGGAVGAAILGAKECAIAGRGGLAILQRQVESKHGVGSLTGSLPVLRRLDHLHKKMEVIPGRVIEQSVGAVIGGAVGLVGGSAAGAATGSRMGWDMGSLLGENLADEKLSNAFPSRGILPSSAHASIEKKSATPGPMTAERAESMRKALGSPPPEFKEEHPPPAEHPWAIVGLLDGTDPMLEAHEARKLTIFQNRTSGNAHGTLHIRRGPSTVRRALPWVAVGLVPLALMASPVLGLAAGVGLWATLETTLKTRETRERECEKLGVPLRNGSSLLELSSGKEVGKDPSSETLSDSQLSELLASNLSPGDSPNVLLLSGHGDRRGGISGYSPARLAHALDQAERKVDLGILEGCQTATLESLQPLAGRVRYALVTQNNMNALGLPWNHLLQTLPESGGDVMEFGKNAVSMIGGIETVPSLSLIDMSKIPALEKSLHELTGQLGFDSQLSHAVEAATVEPPNGSQHSSPPRRIDVGRFLTALEGQGVSPLIRDKIVEVRDKLSEAVSCKQSQGDLSGLSMEDPASLSRR